MRKLSNKHEALLREAEANFSNASGDLDSDFSGDVFPADGDSEYFPMNNENQSYADGGAQAVAIPDFDRTYTVTVTNTDVVAQPVVLLGANQFFLTPNFGNPAVVTVTVGESSYIELLQDTQQMPFQISGFRLESTNVAQLSQVLQITKRDATGVSCTYPLQVGNYFSAFQFQAGIREVFPYNIYFEGTTRINFTMLASTTVVFSFFVGKRLDTSNKLKGRPVTEVSPHTLPFIKKQELVLAPKTIQALNRG